MFTSEGDRQEGQPQRSTRQPVHHTSPSSTSSTSALSLLPYTSPSPTKANQVQPSQVTWRPPGDSRRERAVFGGFNASLCSKQKPWCTQLISSGSRAPNRSKLSSWDSLQRDKATKKIRGTLLRAHLPGWGSALHQAQYHRQFKETTWGGWRATTSNAAGRNCSSTLM